VSGTDRLPELSVILPCYNEEGNLEPLTHELVSTLEKLDRPYEVIFVDDASRDGSDRVLAQLGHRYPELRVVRHRINSGESAAQASGFRVARGEILVTMDSDQQNDPGDIPALLAALERCDVVSGVRARREDDWLRRVSSKLANAFRNWLTGDRVTDAGCTFRALRREVALEMPVFNGMHRFLPTLARYQGFRVSEIPVNHRPRVAGVSKYGVGNRLVRGITDCVAMRWWKRRAVRTDRREGALR
jgi:dolichol-phosphate mannosyltransferase